MLPSTLTKVLAPAMLASSFILVINKPDGTQTKIPVSEISEMYFIENTKLTAPDPQVHVFEQNATISWAPVENAVSYRYRLDYNGSETTTQTMVSFSGLAAGEHTFTVYASPGVDGSDIYSESDAGTIRFTIEEQAPPIGEMNPGDKGTVFAPGVSMTSGFVDVDKAYTPLATDPAYGSDELMCWACSDAAILQWWLNDYQRVYGTPYPMNKQLMAESKFYSTPVMDEFTKSFVDEGYDEIKGLTWFGEGGDINERLNGHFVFKDGYANASGNFMGIPEGKMAEKCYVNKNAYWDYGTPSGLNLTLDTFKIKWSKDIIDYLQQGPMALSVVEAGHAINLWGVDYEVDSNGNPIITHLHITENSGTVMDGNHKNAIEGSCAVNWGTNRYGGHRMYYTHPSIPTHNREFTAYTVLKSWRFFEKDW